jgi:hypothetical protein
VERRTLSARWLGLFASPLVLACGARALPPNVTGQAGRLGPPVVTETKLDGHALLTESAARAIAAGAGPVAVVASSEAVERERLGAFVEVPTDVCLLAYARASTSVEDLDLAAFNDEGNPLAVDDAPDPHPTVLVCPPHPSRVYLAAVAASGEGLVVVGAQLVPVGRAGEVGTAMNARGTRAPSNRAADAWPGLDDHINRHHETIGGKWEVFRKVAVTLDSRVPSTLGFPLEAGACTDALVVPDEDVAIVEVEAQDEQGRVLARGSLGTRDRTLTVCSPFAVNGTLTVRPHIGQGLAAVILSRGSGDLAKGLAVAPDLVWSAATLPIDQAGAKREADLHQAGYSGLSSSYRGTLGLGSVRSVKVDLPGRACSRVDVVGGAPAALLSADAWTEQGELVSSAEGASLVTLFACAGGPLRLELQAHGRPGPFQALVRPETWIDPAFALHPVAAARMLTRMAAGPAQLFQGSPVASHAFAMDGGHETSWNEVIPAGKCLHVVAGAAGAGAGLVGRLSDAGTGEEIDRAHAALTIALEACAPETALRTVRVSVRVMAGRLDVVVGSRLSG